MQTQQMSKGIASTHYYALKINLFELYYYITQWQEEQTCDTLLDLLKNTTMQNISRQF